MEKDINVLLETTNNEIFEEQSKCWPGLRIFRKYGWKCVCGEDGCFRRCSQMYGNDFPEPEAFAQYLDEVAAVEAEIKSIEDLESFVEGFAERYKRKKTLH